MKTKIFSLLMIICAMSINAQVSRIFNITDGKLFPRFVEKHRMKVWKNKVFYQGAGISVPFPNNFKTCNLVVSDGTEAGTKILKDLALPTEYDTYIVQWAATENYLYFTCRTKQGVYQLWSTDGTAENTTKIDESFRAGFTNPTVSYISIGGPNSDEFIPLQQIPYFNYPDNYENQPITIGNKLFYSKYDNVANEYYMYETEGTAQSIKKVPGTYSYGKSSPMSYLVFNNKLYFLGNNFSVNQYSGVKTYYPQVYVYDALSTNPQNYSTGIFDDGLTRFGAVFNGKLYFDTGNFSIYSTTDLGKNKKLVYKAPCTMGSSGPKESQKKFQFRQTENYMFIVGNNTCDENLYTVDKNDVLKKIPLPTDNQINEIIIGDNYSYIHSTDYVLKTVNGNSYWENQYTYNITSINPDQSAIRSTKAYYAYYWGQVLNNVLYFANLPEKQSSLTVEGNNLELWRTNAATAYMANEINKAEGMNYNYQTGQYFNAKLGSSPKNFFKINNKIYFFGVDEGKNYLFSINPDFTFNNSTANNDWNNNENWNSQIVPFEEDDVTIPANQSPVITKAASAKNLVANAAINLTSGNLNIGGNLNLGGKITLNDNNLNLLNASKITNFNSSNYIVTNGNGKVNVENLSASRGTVTLPIGTANAYLPVKILNSGTSDTFSANVTDASQSTTTNAVNAIWNISEATYGGSNANLTFVWDATQELSGFDRNQAKVLHKTSSWIVENTSPVSGSNPYEVTATGITTFSPFAVGMETTILGTSDLSKSKVQVYPNPFNESLNIHTQENGVVYFYDLSGKLVTTSILSKGNNSLNKSSLNKGIYIYQIKNSNGENVSSGKIIKN